MQHILVNNSLNYVLLKIFLFTSITNLHYSSQSTSCRNDVIIVDTVANTQEGDSFKYTGFNS